MFLFAHHMAVELFGREFSPHGTFQHVCVFAVVALLFGTSAYGIWTLGRNALKRVTERQREAGEPQRFA